MSDLEKSAVEAAILELKRLAGWDSFVQDAQNYMDFLNNWPGGLDQMEEFRKVQRELGDKMHSHLEKIPVQLKNYKDVADKYGELARTMYVGANN